MITSLYTIKSFVSIGDSLDKCYDCEYCRANDDLKYHYHTLPSEINPLFKKLPIAVNLFYGDPTLQWENTINILKQLEIDKHEGIVMIVTKGKLKDIPKMSLNLHVGISYGPDKISQDNFEYNLKVAENSWYKYSIEFRPICNGINDSEDLIRYVFSMAKKYSNVPISYCGLQLPPKNLPEKYKPYDNREFSGQKYISKQVNEIIRKCSIEFGISVFHKTSCMLSTVHGLNYDYNIHFLKPIGVECHECINREMCNSFKVSSIDLPFDYEIVEKENYKCSFVRNGLCKVPNKECLNMRGIFIRPKLDSLTRGDVRIIKWLTGCMVSDVNNLIETPYISDFWKK